MTTELLLILREILQSESLFKEQFVSNIAVQVVLHFTAVLLQLYFICLVKWSGLLGTSWLTLAALLSACGGVELSGAAV